MSLKKSFIKMSITKQLYFGVFGAAILTCVNVLVLIFITSLILIIVINNSVSNVLEKMDSHMMTLYGQFIKLAGSLFFDEGKNEIEILRYFYSNLKEASSNSETFELVDDPTSFSNINLDNYFVTINETNIECEQNKNCIFYQMFENQTFNFITKKIFVHLLPIMLCTIKIKPYDRNTDYIFSELYYVLNDNNIIFHLLYRLV